MDLDSVLGVRTKCRRELLDRFEKARGRSPIDMDELAAWSEQRDWQTPNRTVS